MIDSQNAVEIKNLTKKYGSTKVVDNISFSVKKGEIMGFLGPNGAGKSTTMNIICGCISPSEGSAYVCGYDVLENPEKTKAKIGYLPEQPPLYFDMTVLEYLNFVYDLKKVKNKKAKYINEIMKLVKIEDMKDRMIKNLSKGYKQRVGLAQALIGDPEVLILDEPTVGLDPKQIIEIRNVIKSIGKKCTVILSTHILQEVSAVCDRVTIISHGKIVAQNTISALEEETGGKNKFILKVSASKGEAERVIRNVQGIEKVEKEGKDSKGNISYILTQYDGADIRIPLFEALSNAQIKVCEFKSASMSLEDIFIKLTATDAFYNAGLEESENDSNI